MTHRSPSYRSSECCNADCHLGTVTEPCWGEVEVVDEEYDEQDYYWVHACQGHKILWDGIPYVPESVESPDESS